MGKLGEEYTDKLTAEQLIRYIANDYVELSQEKIKAQENYYRRICKRYIELNKTTINKETNETS